MTSTPGDRGHHPPAIAPGYRSSTLRGPTQPLVPLARGLSERTGPVHGRDSASPLDHDLTRNARRGGEPIGERIVVAGQVLDEHARPVPETLIEIWQANAAGRYVHTADQHDAPLDPNFFGAGRCVTDTQGNYRFYTVKPGAYPWANHHNGWRPNHIHFSLFGSSITSRLVTQMYFPGDPLLALDPIYMAVPEAARKRLVASFDLDVTEPDFALGYRFDIVLRGEAPTPMET